MSVHNINDKEHYYRVRHNKLVFFYLSLTARNTQVRFFLKVVLKFRDWRNFASKTNAYCVPSTVQFSNISGFLVNFEFLQVLGAIYRQKQLTNNEIDKYLSLFKGWNKKASKNHKTLNLNSRK